MLLYLRVLFLAERHRFEPRHGAITRPRAAHAARARKSPLLNRAYAHLASAQTARVANELADRLVAMGFEELEAAQAVFPSSLPLFDDAGTSRLPIEALELNLPVTPGFAADLVGDLLPGVCAWATRNCPVSV